MVLLLVAATALFVPRTSYAFGRHRKERMTIEEYRQMRFGTPGSLDLTNEIGPLALANTSFSLSGMDAAGRQHDVSLSGHALGVDRLVFDQVGIAWRIGVIDHFSIGIPLSLGGAPVTEPTPTGLDPNAPHVDGSAAMIFGFGVSPGYEINFGDSAFRFDAGLMGHLIFLPTNWETHDKHGHLVSADATAFQVAFEPRLTILPYASRDLGVGFFGEMDAARPENWACGLVVQMRWGRAG